jgi:hypothetical protein
MLLQPFILIQNQDVAMKGNPFMDAFEKIVWPEYPFVETKIERTEKWRSEK